MPLIIGKIKCYFCKEKDGFMYSVCDYGIYGDVGRRIFYHPECLEVVQINPENSGHTLMDKAIHIDDLRKENIKQCNKNLIEDFKKKIEKLHQSHFEKMMPRKR
jgi:hypothetical protein